MRFAFCLFKYFPYGGLQRDFRAIVNECLDRGHQVDIYALEWIGEPLPNVNITLFKKNKITNHRNYWMFSEKIVNHVRKMGYDAVIGFNKTAGLDIYYAADPCYKAFSEVIKHRLYQLNPRFHYLQKLESEIFHPMSKTHVLVMVEKQIDDFHQYYHTPCEKFHLMPPWLDYDRFPNENVAEIRKQLRKTLNIAHDEKMILFVGSGFKIKGLERAIIALSKLPESTRRITHLFVIGQDKPNVFKRIAKQLNIADKVHFLGGRNDVPQFMVSADLLLHPAHSENAGYVLLEAIVSGLPVLTTDSCGFSTHVKQVDAGIVLSSPFEQEVLNKRLLLMLTDKEKIRQWKKNGLAYPKHCNLHGMPKRATDIIEWRARLPEKMQAKITKNFFIYPELIDFFPRKNQFNAVMQLEGDVYRELDGRKTLAFRYNNKRYFAKLHSGVGWKEIWKNISQFRLPTISANNEFKAIKFFEKLKINTTPVVGFGQKGINPATKKSFIMTKALENTISLEELGLHWKTTLKNVELKNQLIKSVAMIAKKMHENGVNHRDFYLCHILLDKNSLNQKNDLMLYVIDLHRAQIRKKTPMRWQVKDIASLYYSTLDIELNKRDYLRFIKIYTGLPLKKALKREAFWEDVIAKTYRLTNRAFKFNTEISL